MAIAWSASSMPSSSRPSMRARSVWNTPSQACSGESGQALEQPLGLRQPASADRTGQAAERLVGERQRDPRRVLGAAGARRSPRMPARAPRSPRPDARPTRRRSPSSSRSSGARPPSWSAAVKALDRLGPRVPADGVPASFERRDHLVVRTGYLGRGVRATG